MAWATPPACAWSTRRRPRRLPHLLGELHAAGALCAVCPGRGDLRRPHLRQRGRLDRHDAPIASKAGAGCIGSGRALRAGDIPLTFRRARLGSPTPTSGSTTAIGGGQPLGRVVAGPLRSRGRHPVWGDRYGSVAPVTAGARRHRPLCARGYFRAAGAARAGHARALCRRVSAPWASRSVGHVVETPCASPRPVAVFTVLSDTPALPGAWPSSPAPASAPVHHRDREVRLPVARVRAGHRARG